MLHTASQLLSTLFLVQVKLIEVVLRWVTKDQLNFLEKFPLFMLFFSSSQLKTELEWRNFSINSEESIQVQFLHRKFCKMTFCIGLSHIGNKTQS